jgi:hypothetical protein
VTSASLRLAYLHLTIASGAALGRSQLRTLADFIHRCTSSEFNVYAHDDVGGGRAVAAAAMLLMLQGGSWPAIQEHFTAAELASLSPRQSQVIVQLASVLRSAGTSLLVIPTPVPGSAPGEHLAGEVLS